MRFAVALALLASSAIAVEALGTEHEMLGSRHRLVKKRCAKSSKHVKTSYRQRQSVTKSTSEPQVEQTTVPPVRANVKPAKTTEPVVTTSSTTSSAKAEETTKAVSEPKGGRGLVGYSDSKCECAGLKGLARVIQLFNFVRARDATRRLIPETAQDLTPRLCRRDIA